MPSVLIDISAHGFGHLSQAAPVLNALVAALPDLQLTVRSGLSRERLAARIEVPFSHCPGATDFGYAMHNAIDLDLVASAARYRAFHADWNARVAAESEWLAARGFDAVVSNVSYLPLAGAARAGIAAVALSSLNWADLFADNFGDAPWARPIWEQMLGAYRSARSFLRLSPGMPMADLDNVAVVGPVCRLRAPDRAGLARRLGIEASATWLLVAMGGMDFPLDVTHWPRLDGLRYLVPAALAVARDDVCVFERPDVDFTQLVASVDVVLTKPGYGTFVEAACHGRPVLYVERDGWGEQAPLADWLHRHTPAQAVRREQLIAGDFAAGLAALALQPRPAKPEPTGIAEAVAAIRALIAP